MKKVHFLIYLLAININISAQSIGIGTGTPDASAMLDVKSSTKGMLIPRTSTTSRLAIVNPAKGLMLYDTTTSSFWFHNGADWNEVTAGSNGWNLTGNADTDSALHFIGTTDDKPFHFRLNNLWAGEMHPTNGNIFLGMSSGLSNTTAGRNTAIGTGALQNQSFNYGGETNNVAIGFEALTLNNPTGTGTGISNTAVGSLALRNNTIGYDNTAIGASVLYFNNTGFENTAIGRQALFSNNNGRGNTATGYKTLRFNNTGNYNTANGYETLYSNTTGTLNTANGYQALYSNSAGNDNTANGYYALSFNTIGNKNTANGRDALSFNVAGSKATAIGYGAMHYANNTATPFDNYNVAVGYEALMGSFIAANNTGNYNTATGYQSLSNNRTGDFNTANGNNALYSNTSGNYNTAIGNNALSLNTSGNYNTANGNNALSLNTSGNYNTANGINALSNNIGGEDNTAVGFFAKNDLSSSSYNTLIGGGAHCNASNSVVIGYNSFTNTNNLALLGNPTTLFTGGYTAWSNFSDGRFKKDIDENVRGLDFIMRLRPVTYHMDVWGLYNFWGISPYGKVDSMISSKSRYFIDDAITKKEAIRMTGFVAQEVEKAAIASNYDFDGVILPTHDKDHYRIAYGEFVVPLVKAVQELSEQTKEQKKIIEQQQNKIVTQQQQYEILLKRVEALEKKN